MSNTNNNLQTQTSNALHNAIMEAGGKDRPPMLAPGNYVQWKSRIKRYIDTKPNNELIHYCLQNPPYKFKWTEKTVPVAEGSSETTTEGYMENYKNVSQDIRDQLNAEAEASQELKSVSYHKFYDIMKQHQNEVNKIRAERLARTANPLALDNTPRINRGTGYDNQRTVNVVGARENVGAQLNAKQADWKDDTDDEPDDHELEAHYIEHPEQPGSVNNTYLEEQGDTNITIDSLDMCNNGETVDQDEDDLAKEHDLLSSLIEKLKCDIEDFKTKNKSLESSNNHFKELNNELSKTNQLMFKDLKKFQAKLDRYHDVNYASKVAIDCAKAKGGLMSYTMELKKSFNEYTRKISDLNQTISEMKKELFAHQEIISIMSQEKEAQIKFYKTREDIN
ncbi:hypothetical protein Tco_0564737 [Tanacetum coccineum]